MRKVHIVLATVGGVLIGISGYFQGPALQAAEKAKTAPADANGNNPVDANTPVSRRAKQVQTPFINGIPGQTDVPGFSDTPTPVVPD